MKGSTNWDKSLKGGVLCALFWLAVWQTVSLFVPKILFASPWRTVRALLGLVGTGSFWLSILNSLGKIAAGFVLAFALGTLLAAVCHRWTLPRVLMRPPLEIMKSVPVACFVVVALIWIRSPSISILTAFFVVLPLTFINIYEGLQCVDGKMLEMVRLFRVPAARQLRALYLPSLTPYVLSCCRVAVGMALKSGIAGEIIGLPKNSIGEQLYLSKLYLDTSGLFAWSLVIIVLSAALEKLLVHAIGRLQRRCEVEK